MNLTLFFNFPAESGGCSEEELQELAASGVDLAKSSIDCGSDFPQLDGLSNVPQLDEMDKEKRSKGNMPHPIIPYHRNCSMPKHTSHTI